VLDKKNQSESGRWQAYDHARVRDGECNAKADLQARASAVKAVATSWDDYAQQCRTIGVEVEVIPAGGPRRFTSVRHSFTGTDNTPYAWTSRDLGKGLGHAALPCGRHSGLLGALSGLLGFALLRPGRRPAVLEHARGGLCDDRTRGAPLARP